MSIKTKKQGGLALPAADSSAGDSSSPPAPTSPSRR